MKISYSWLKEYINTDLSADELAKILINCGLEVASVEKHEQIRGGLKGLVIGEVKSVEKHPDADKLKVTFVDIGIAEPLQIVCGAANVAKGQKVVVATVGSTLYPAEAEPFKINKSKIRGVESFGMICAEDEIGLGSNHDGIMVLDPDAKIGNPASEYFNLNEDYVLEIELTPNRVDAASHVGVARDVAAVINSKKRLVELVKPDISQFSASVGKSSISVTVDNPDACPRYSSLCIKNVQVGDSPDWLKNRLTAIGQKPINNIVDITNYVLFELGHPLHAFDADKIDGNKVIVKCLPDGSRFVTLDGVERILSAQDLMICNANKGMCVAGVFGGVESGVTGNTKNIFLESAYFNPVYVRKTAKRHGLNTDASFRFERGADYEITVTALKRAAMLIKEVAGGEISEISDIYPNIISATRLKFSFENCNKHIGHIIPAETIINILTELEIKIIEQNSEYLYLEIPSFKVDVKREADVVEEILRIYGYNNIPLPANLKTSVSYSQKPDKEKFLRLLSSHLVSKGFSEMMNNSLTAESYYSDSASLVKVLNPLSAELNVMRSTLMFNALECVRNNINHKNTDLKLFESGHVYYLDNETTETNSPLKKYKQEHRLSIAVAGNKVAENWIHGNVKEVDFYFLKGITESVIMKAGLVNSEKIEKSELNSPLFSWGIQYSVNNKIIAQTGLVNSEYLKKFDIEQDVYYSDLFLENIFSSIRNIKTKYVPLEKFPRVRRDLALLVDKNITYKEIETIALHTEKKLIKSINLFDVYEGKNLPEGKKSYAISYILYDENKTLTDEQVDRVMNKLIAQYSEKIGASLR